MNILITMAGAGTRFAKVGYKEPKPFIDVAGTPMIKRVVDNINLKGKYIFIVQEAHLEQFPYMKQKLQELHDDVEIVTIDQLTEGAACTALLARDLINNQEPLLICNSDQCVDWDSGHFIKYITKNNFDGAIPYFLSDSPKHSYSQINYTTKLITQVAEKQVISNLATVGIYYWRQGNMFVECAEQMIADNIRFNNEFYICPVYNTLIHRHNGRVCPYPVFEMNGMGTPEELEIFLSKMEQ